MIKKRVLFIGIGFYDYEDAIIDEFNKLDYEVDYYSEVPPNTIKYRFYSRLKNQVKLNEIRKSHTATIIKSLKVNYETIFIIKCEYFTESNLKQLRKKNPKSKFILYLWDSLNRFPSIALKFPYFDSIFSFDRLDCIANPKMQFNPLFYRNEYKYNEKSKYIKKVDIYHIGWYHSDRLEFIRKLTKIFEEYNLKYNILLFTGYFSYLFQAILGGELRNNKKFLIFKPVSARENFENIISAKATLDIAHVLQSGLTMRTIELLGAQRKIITTNEDIINYDFYDPQNVMIINRDNPQLDENFFLTEFKKTPSNILKKYSITEWIKRML
jgi:hypothetical protein